MSGSGPQTKRPSYKEGENSLVSPPTVGLRDGPDGFRLIGSLKLRHEPEFRQYGSITSLYEGRCTTYTRYEV